MKFLKKLIFLVVALLVVLIISFNLKLYYQPKYSQIGHSKINIDLVEQLHFLKEKINSGAAMEMQNIYPEGSVFLQSLYALSWVEMVKGLKKSDDLYQEAIVEIDQTILSLDSDESRSTFNENLDLSFGVFYKGWSNYVLASKIRLLDGSSIDSNELLVLQSNCEEILEVLHRSDSPFLESYRKGCWPADMTVAMASIALANQQFEGKYTSDLKNWIIKVDAMTDSLGLIPHSVISESGEVLESSRGSSQSLILNFLFEIDSTYARSKFDIYKSTFLDYRLGLPGIREYPHGISGKGDIDSGPVLFGIGGAASIVGQRVMSLYGEDEIAIGLRNSIETFALGMTYRNKKSYLLGQLPILDGFIAWSNSIEAQEKNKLVSQKNWRWCFHVLSFLILLGIGFFIWQVFRIK